VDDPRGLKLEWQRLESADLVKLLDDRRPAVRARAIGQLGKLGGEAVPALEAALRESGSSELRRSAVWALTRIEGEGARAAARAALGDRDESVRHAAIHSAAVRRDAGACAALTDILAGNAPQLARAAAEALGRIGDRRAVAPLLAAAAAEHDRVLEHSLTYALIEIGDTAGTAAGLQAPSSRARRASLVALDQMDRGGLKASAVTPLLASSDPLLKQTAWWIAGHHAEWGGELAGFFRSRLSGSDGDAGKREELESELAQLGQNTAIQELVAESAVRAPSRSGRLTALGAMGRAHLRQTPPAWTGALVRVLAERDADLVRGAVAAARAIVPPKPDTPELSAALAAVARSRSLPSDVRVQALAAIPAGPGSLDPELFALLRASIDPEQPVSARTAAAGVLGKAKLEREQLLELTETLKSAGPMEVAQLLPAFDNAADEELGLRMVSALKESKGRANLRPDLVRARLEKYPESVRRQGEQLLISLDVDTAAQKRRLEGLLSELKGGDIRRGQTVFNGQKAACRSCHTMGYLGGKVGPDLTRIGQIRTERDLLESIIYPDASFVRSYEPIVVVTKSGEMHSGVLRRDAPDEVVLATGATDEVRIARSEIADLRPGTVSVMPSGLEAQLSRQEMADLLAFLKAARREAQ
jgi:putative heme-binding domain-containing protein